MADELTLQCAKLRLVEEEKEIVDLGIVATKDSNDNLELLLVGKLLTERPYNVEAFKRTIMKVWAPMKGMVIRVLGPNLYAFQFFHWRDKDKVMIGRPWCFKNSLIVMKEIEGDEQPEEVELNHLPFWVRVKKLPFNCRSVAHVRALTMGMGDILEFEEDVWGLDRFRRVKIKLDVTKPLRRVKASVDKKGREVTVEFSYERLPFFFFACGVMGHSERDCTMVSEEDKKKGLDWGMFLRASPRKSRGKEIEEIASLSSCKRSLFVTKKMESSKTRSGATMTDLVALSGKLIASELEAAKTIGVSSPPKETPGTSPSSSGRVEKQD